MQNWYCIHTTTGREKIAQSRLESFKIETLLPFTKFHYVDRFENERQKTIALFPGYLFANCEREQYSLAASGWRKEILRLVGFESGPQMVPIEVIEEIRARMIGEFVRLDDGLVVGCDVLITSGSFQSQAGKLFSENPDERVSVLLQMFGKPFVHEMPRSFVRAVTLV